MEPSQSRLEIRAAGLESRLCDLGIGDVGRRWGIDRSTAQRSGVVLLFVRSASRERAVRQSQGFVVVDRDRV